MPRSELKVLLGRGHTIRASELAGAAYRGVSLGLPGLVERLTWTTFQKAFVRLHFGFDASKLDPWTTGVVEFFANAKLAALAATVRLRRFARTYHDVMARFDVLMSPTTPGAASPLGHLAPDVQAGWDGVRCVRPHPDEPGFSHRARR
jgi:Asp-tRNA(Asn)/Glu-tRNA(Gln) amidotransferase A subunit family amidase